MAAPADETTLLRDAAPRQSDGEPLLVSPDAPLSPSSAKHHSYVAPDRAINVWKLGFLAFVCICGGPFGIEPAVQAAGAGPTLLSIIVLSIFWAGPQAMMTAELSTMFPSNGGYVLWVTRGLGPYHGFMNAINSVASNTLDLPLYPVLFAQYVQNAWPSLTSFELWFVKGAALVLVTILNIIGIDCVAYFSVGFTAFVIAPFIVQLFLVKMDSSEFTRVAETVDYSAFVGTILWNFQGWDSLGCLAGEVKNGRKTYPYGAALGISMIAANYMLPVMTGVSKDPDTDDWNDGNLVNVAKKIGRGYGYWVLAAASVATLSEFNAIMATTSRALQSTAMFKMAPSFLAWNPRPFKTPVAAILLQAAVTSVMMAFSFDTLVVLDTLFNNVSLVLELWSFLKLKHDRPDLPRPYVVPGGIKGAWLVSIPKFLIIGYAFWSVGWSLALAIGVGCNILFLILGLVYVNLVKDVPMTHDWSKPDVEVIHGDGSAASSRRSSRGGGGMGETDPILTESGRTWSKEDVQVELISEQPTPSTPPATAPPPSSFS